MDASQGQVLLAVLNDDATVNLYISDDWGTNYSLSLQNIITNNFQWNSGIESFDFYMVSIVIVCKYVYSSSTAAYQKYCALSDKSTKSGTPVENHLINIFGYGGACKCTHGSHNNIL